MITTVIDPQNRFHIQYKRGKNLYESVFPVGDGAACLNAVQLLFDYVIDKEIPDFSRTKLYQAINRRMEHHNRIGG